MARYLTRRLLLAVVTLWLLVTIVFVISNVLPRDVGRTILGPFAPQESVDALNERLGTNRPIVVQYLDAMVGVVTLDFGESFVSGQPVLPAVLAAAGRSAKLAGLALIITIPLSIAAGLYAARRRDRKVDRAIVLLGVTSSSIPEFITATILVVVVGVQLGWLPVLATPPPDADILTQIRYLLMPAIAMAIVYFGYIARMTRAGTIEVLQSDYTRTATMKGLTTSQTMRRHVLRNALIPTVAVIAVQIGYLFGGIIAVEKIFNYNGMGATMLFAAQRKDLPMLTAGVIVIGIVYMLATLTADLITAWMNPRIRLDAKRCWSTSSSTPVRRLRWRARPRRSDPRLAARPCVSWSGGRPSSSGSSSWWGGSCAPSSASASRRTTHSTTSPRATCPRVLNTGSARIGSGETSCRG